MTLSSLIKKSSILVATAASLSLSAWAQEAPAKAELKPGVQVPSLELDGVVWVQGEPVKSLNQKGKVYLIECWATWCGPCIAAIPHVNHLSQEFGDEGLVVIGMNVWEEGLDKVEKFVTKKGDGMSYRVAYSGGKQSAFVDQWLTPAGARGIPFALLVRDGKLITTGHPNQMTSELIKTALADDFSAEAFAAKKAEEEAAAAARTNKIREMVGAAKWAELKAFALSELADDPGEQRTILEIVAMNSANWKEVAELFEGTEGLQRTNFLIQTAFSAPGGEGDKAFAAQALEVFTDESVKAHKSLDRQFAPLLARVRYLWISGDQDAAKELFKGFKEEVAANEQVKARLGGMLERVAEKMEAGELPAIRGLLR